MTNARDSFVAQQNTGHHDTHPPEKYTAQLNKEGENKQPNPEDQKHLDPIQMKNPTKKGQRDRKQKMPVVEKKYIGI